MHENYTEENQDLISEEQDLVLQEDDNKKIIWQAKDFSIRELEAMELDGDLDLQPKYQRNFVISNPVASRLIESVLMNVPIPVIYLAEEQNGSFSVIDGQQRLTTFLSFLRGKYPSGKSFKLSALKILNELNRKTFSDLSREEKNSIKKTTLHTIIIKKESHEDVKFEIFERLNTGATRLYEDEIRNSVYRGPYVDLLAELEENEDFHFLVDKENYKKRMGYRGMILRFFALTERSYLNYQPSIKQFCNKELREKRYLSEEKASEYRQRFLHCLDLVKIVFGKTAFRRYKPAYPLEEKGEWVSGQMNMALFDIQFYGFMNYSKNDVLRNADLIRDALLDLMITNQEFKDAILINTSNKEVLKKRFSLWMAKLEQIMGDSSYARRCFPYALKQKLFEKKPVCAISGQTILNIDDAEVDHIIPYSKGGPTTEENAQLVLRYFNRAKGDKL